MSTATITRPGTGTPAGCTATKHDTDYAYRSLRCRCPRARAAATAGKRQRRAANRALDAARQNKLAGVQPTHPTPGLAFHDDPARRCAPGRVALQAFYPEGDAAAAIERHTAEVICGPCPVKDACRQDALDRGERHGVWGGLTSRQLAAAANRRKRVNP